MTGGKQELFVHVKDLICHKRNTTSSHGVEWKVVPPMFGWDGIISRERQRGLRSDAATAVRCRASQHLCFYVMFLDDDLLEGTLGSCSVPGSSLALARRRPHSLHSNLMAAQHCFTMQLLTGKTHTYTELVEKENVTQTQEPPTRTAKSNTHLSRTK